MEVLIGVDPHKASVAVAAVDEATGELLELAAFAQDRSGLGSLERWARRFPERRWAVENAGGLGRHLAVRLAARVGVGYLFPIEFIPDSSPSDIR